MKDVRWCYWYDVCECKGVCEDYYVAYKTDEELALRDAEENRLAFYDRWRKEYEEDE